MKKLLPMVLVLLVASAAEAQTKDNLSASIMQSVIAGQQEKAARVEFLEARAREALDQFHRQAAKLHYYDYHFMFQSMDSLRISYLALRSESAAVARKLALMVNEPVSIAGGNGRVRILPYLNMESCTLSPSEQIKFEAFYQALSADLRAAKAQQEKVSLPTDFVQGLEIFREYISSNTELKPVWVLQSMMPLMDSFNKNLQKYPSLGGAMAKEIQQPIEAGWGRKVTASQFITDYACEVPVIQEELEDFQRKITALSD